MSKESQRTVSDTVPAHYANKGDLTTGSIRAHLIRLSAPMVLGIFAIISFQIADMYFIGLLGLDQLAAISFTFPVTMAIFSFMIGMSIATSSVVSRSIGAKNNDEAARISTHAILLSFFISCFIGALGFVYLKPLFHIMGASDKLIPYIWEFMSVWFAGVALVSVPLVINASIRACGDSRTPAMIMMIVAIVNIILDPILMFGWFGFPAMGIAGVAFATLFGNGAAMIAGLYVLRYKKGYFLKNGWEMHLFGDSLKRLLVISIPAGLMSALQPLTNGLLIGLISAYGKNAVAAYGIVYRIESFAFIVIMALATGMAPIIGQNWGAQRYDRVRETLNQALAFSVAWSLAAALLLIPFGKFFAGFFTDDSGTLQIVGLYFMIVAATHWVGNLGAGWGSAFNAMGQPKRAFFILFTKLVLVTIPLAWVGNYFYGLAGLFAGIAFSNLVVGGLTHFINDRYLNRYQYKGDL
jgi:putative MATE family efflux protein